MKYLDGHPQAIVLAAPLLQDRTLSELCDLLSREGVSRLRAVDGIPTDDSTDTLLSSLQISVRHLQRRHPASLAMFLLVGMLPGGALDADLELLLMHL
jgi:hypothetical protein